MIVKSYKTHKVRANDDLYNILNEYLPALEEKCVVVVTSKIISLCQGDVIKDDDIVKKDDLVKKEADYYLEHVHETPYGKVFLTKKNGLLIFSAGIDNSNTADGHVLWPKNLQETTNKIWKYLRKKHKVSNVGVLVTDSRLIPTRTGVVGFGLSWCGFLGLNNLVGKKDVFGKEINMTQVNLVESLATSATVVMGEGAEQTPLAVITNTPFIHYQDRPPTQEELEGMTWPIEKDMYGQLLTAVEWKKGGSGK
ncbi:MAG: coenzyme F420-0:L-glutamate ligase [Candidatus Levyibacteriota bacterium]